MCKLKWIFVSHKPEEKVMLDYRAGSHDPWKAEMLIFSKIGMLIALHSFPEQFLAF
jgi:hypothetical protein